MNKIINEVTFENKYGQYLDIYYDTEGYVDIKINSSFNISSTSELDEICNTIRNLLLQSVPKRNVVPNFRDDKEIVLANGCYDFKLFGEEFTIMVKPDPAQGSKFIQKIWYIDGKEHNLPAWASNMCNMLLGQKIRTKTKLLKALNSPNFRATIKLLADGTTK